VLRIRLLMALVVTVLPGLPSAVAGDLLLQPHRALATGSHNWTGLYAGVVAGYAFGGGDNRGLSGGVAGATVGANYQAPGSWLVMGVEGDAAWSNFGRSETVPVAGATVTGETRADVLATLRARLGVAFERTLVYATGGAAWARNTISVTASGGGFSAEASDSQFHAGYAIGAGVEHAFAGRWSAKVEYLYLGLGSKTYFSQFGGLSSGAVNVHALKAGLNYRFGG
jgi:outer membrane immunogenic protein